MSDSALWLAVSPAWASLVNTRLRSARRAAPTMATPATLANALGPRDILFLSDVWHGRGGREWLSELAPQRAAGARVIAVLGEPSPAEVAQWLRAGASAVMDPGEDELPAEIVSSQTSLVDRFIRWAAARQLSGTMLFFVHTPFEGSARFEAGVLAEAQLGDAAGLQALADGLDADEAPTWLVRDTKLMRPTPPPSRRFAPHILVIEDDPSLRRMVARVLAPLGVVSTAADGVEGVLEAQRTAFDVIVTDLAMPRLDGWGVLRRLRQHPVTGEVATVVLSAHDELREKLAAAHAGARAWVAKGSKNLAAELTKSVNQCLGPRHAAWTALAEAQTSTVSLPLVGATWLLRTMAELDVSGVLAAHDGLTRIEFEMAEGCLVSATVQMGSLRQIGNSALESFLACTGEATVTHVSVTRRPNGPWLFDRLDEAADKANAAARARTENAANQVSRLVVVDELAALYSSFANTKELSVLKSLRKRPSSIDAISLQTGLHLDDVHPVVVDLLRRGVVVPTV